jgi:threonine dehydrogenase-like Zn-dependent dehydrogenase
MDYQLKAPHEEVVTDKPLVYKAALLHGPGKIEYVQESVARVMPTQLLVKMEGCGLCASSVPVWEGREWFEYPLAPGEPGHEGWGVVEEVGNEVSSFRIGDRVALLYGKSFAEYAVVDQDTAVKLPADLDGMPFPGEALGCLMNILERADIRPQQTVAILGIGFIGLGLLQLLAQKEVRIIAVSRRESSLKMAAAYTSHCFRADDKYRTIRSINDLTSGEGCDRVIECTGNQEPLEVATDIIGTYGKLIIAGYHQDGLRQIDFQKWNWKCIDIINAHERSPIRYKEGIVAAVEAVREGRLKINELITHSYPFKKLKDGLDDLVKGGEGWIKSYVKFN